MAPNAETAKKVEGIFRKKLEQEFGDAVRFGPITVEYDGDRDGQPKLAVVIVFEHPDGGTRHRQGDGCHGPGRSSAA